MQLCWDEKPAAPASLPPRHCYGGKPVASRYGTAPTAQDVGAAICRKRGKRRVGVAVHVLRGNRPSAPGDRLCGWTAPERRMTTVISASRAGGRSVVMYDAQMMAQPSMGWVPVYPGVPGGDQRKGR